MNQEQLQIASDCLHAIKDNEGGFRRIDTGICDAITEYSRIEKLSCEDSDVIYIELKKLMRRWPAGTGDKVYPVPDPEYRDDLAQAMKKYVGCQDCWTGEYGESRLKLVDWLINEVESQFD